MNRIKKFLDSEIEPIHDSENSLLKAPETEIDRCCFCNQSIENKLFRAWSHPEANHESVICSDCVKTLAVFAKFTDNYSLWFNEPVNYLPLRQQILKRLSIESNDVSLNEMLAEVGLRFLKRSSAILGTGESLDQQDWDRDRRTGVSLETPRIAIIGDAKVCMSLMKIVCEEIGLLINSASLKEIHSGKAYNDLVIKLSGNSAAWADHAMLICEGYTEPNVNCGVVFIVSDAGSLPKDVEWLMPRNKHESK